MNFKKQAQQLEKFLEEELTRKPPIALLPDGSLAYNNFIIKKNSKETWTLRKAGGYTLDTFNLKSSAISAAKLYGATSFRFYNELKILDEMYFKHTTDAERYKYRYTTTKDMELRDLFISRYIEAKGRADYAKKQIVRQFKALF